ncbi:hypothetical protein ACIQLK_10210 [Microbacterium sp. NPDC091382]|uniref:hypothetical protein n=1 Tax=Microbacterium sp. NPDC091382 TaxID=3364210 RepID=UPI0037FD9DD2
MDRARTKILSEIELSLDPGETVVAAVHTSNGRTEHVQPHEGVLVATDRRLRFRGKSGWTGRQVHDESFPYAQIRDVAFSRVEVTSSAGTYGPIVAKGRLALTCSGVPWVFERQGLVAVADDAEVKALADEIEARIG